MSFLGPISKFTRRLFWKWLPKELQAPELAPVTELEVGGDGSTSPHFTILR